jgi:hypothetical protein
VDERSSLERRVAYAAANLLAVADYDMVGSRDVLLYDCQKEWKALRAAVIDWHTGERSVQTVDTQREGH